MNHELLRRPFEPTQVRQRPGQHGKTLSYVDVAAVIGRLNEGCESWSFEIVEHQIQHDEVIVLGKLTADGMVKSAFGGSTITIDKSGQVVSLADDLKSAASDALKKAATLLGVGLELYGGTVQAPVERQQAPGLANPADRVTTRQLAAILFSDIVGYTELMNRDSNSAMSLVKKSMSLQKEIVQKNNGIWLKEIGDGALIQFSSALDAVQCAIEIQRMARADLDARLRIGVHLGDITIENDDIFFIQLIKDRQILPGHVADNHRFDSMSAVCDA